MIEKRLKGTNSSYNHSHQKTYKSEAKPLTRSSVPDTIFSNKQQATSNKQQATSNKQQATSNKQQSGINFRSAQTNSQLNTNFLTVNRTHKSKSPSLCVFYITHSIKPLRGSAPKNPTYKRGFQRGVPFGSAGTTSVASRSKEGVIGGEKTALT